MSEVIKIGARRELFVDDYLIAEMNGVRLELQRPERREIAFSADAAWEDNVAGFNSMVQEGAKVRLYYRASIPDLGDEDMQIVALAESTDGGKSFTRPDLGLVEFNGSKKNNILSIGGPPRIPPAFLDTNPSCRPEERYKGLSCKWMGLFAMCSADGLGWRPMLDGPVEMEGAFDTVNTAFWDTEAGCYRCFTRSWADPAAGFAPVANVVGGCIRTIQGSTSEDFIHWTKPVQNQYDDQERMTQLYTNAVRPCPGAEHIYLGFPNRYVADRVTNPEHPYPGINDALFMSSRDSVHWKRCLEAWVRPGLDEMNWTDRNNYPTWGLVQSSATEWSMYISEHYRHPQARPRLRRLAIRPHGFVSVHADYAGGEFVTKPLSFSGKELQLNYATSAAGSIRVEIQDETGAPLKNFGLDDMEPIFGDELDAPVAWKSGGDLSAFSGKPVRFRFVLQDADLFALRTGKK